MSAFAVISAGLALSLLLLVLEVAGERFTAPGSTAMLNPLGPMLPGTGASGGEVSLNRFPVQV